MMLETVYPPKFRQLLEEVRKEALERGFLCDEPGDLTDEDVRWFVLVRPAGTNPSEEAGVDVSITAAESEHFDGEEGGVNFILDVVSYEGVIVGGLHPYNYTDRCWVPRADEDAVAARWALLNDAFDASAVVDSIEEFFARE